jgi:hypothetical protein
MTRLPAILNVMNNKFCVTFHARSWIIFLSLARKGLQARLACEIEHASLYCP